MKKAKFLVSHFDAGSEKYKAGEVYDLTDDTRLCIARGAAEEVDVADEKPPTKPSEGLKVDELKAALTAKGIAIPDGAKKEDLAKLLDDAATAE